MEQINIGMVVKKLSESYNVSKIRSLMIYNEAQDRIYGYHISHNKYIKGLLTNRELDIKAYELADRYLRMEQYLNNKK